MSGIRPLPPHPNLEFEKKQAKARARRLGVRLSEAQFQVAREYGFASWPKLVRYFGDVERQGPMAMMPGSLEECERHARSVLGSHRARRGRLRGTCWRMRQMIRRGGGWSPCWTARRLDG